MIGFQADQFEDVIWRVIQTRPFQRLRRVKQLGFSDFVYPGATHSRLAHSIGVFHTARQLMSIIREKVGSSNWNASKANAALAAALVHDVGHGPFSHAFEEVGKRLSLKLAHHEHVSDVLIRDSEISSPLKELGSGFANDVAEVIASAGPRSVYDAVVSSQFDADRLDYIRRDRLMAGSSHGVIDYDWLISNLQVETISTGVDDQKVSDLQTFVIGPKGLHATEAYVLGLFQLYPTIYLHKTTRGIEKIFTELMVKVFELARSGFHSKVGLHKDHPLLRFVDDPTNLERAICLDDSVVYGALSQFCEADDPLVSELALRIRDRKTFKCFDVLEYIRKKMPTAQNAVDGRKAISRVALSSMEKIELWKKTSCSSLLLKDETSRSPYKKFEESK
ncbi:HD domain-containing protein [Sphingobium sp. DC-2]|uniref:HD domain-containing protein n=1 Tax=Sphingobium sp. DC-2 TaxID=1303256 RepID=UPI0012DCBDA1|nr:HD domain-containing protein [Sphingobium sp. DC-2]